MLAADAVVGYICLLYMDCWWQLGVTATVAVINGPATDATGAYGTLANDVVAEQF